NILPLAWDPIVEGHFGKKPLPGHGSRPKRVDYVLVKLITNQLRQREAEVFDAGRKTAALNHGFEQTNSYCRAIRAGEGHDGKQDIHTSPLRATQPEAPVARHQATGRFGSK